jgi:NADP-dependent 3-hydroxy acid dehydrogenase YdfG
LSGALAGQVALVTGAGRGIGRAVALALAREGAAVALASRTRAELAAVAAEVRDAGARALAVPTDVTQDAAVDALVEQTVAELGGLQILVTAAGTATFGPVSAAKATDWDAMLAVNLRAVMVSCRAALAPMIRQRRGTIVNIASIAASRPIPGAAAYSATKAGVVGWSRVLAEEVRTEGIRVGVLLPGAVATPLWDTIPNAPARERMLAPADVARAVVLMVTLPPGAALEEVALLPAGGIL